MNISSVKKGSFAVAIAAAAALLGGCSGTNCSACALPVFHGGGNPTPPPKVNLHLALVGDDGSGEVAGITAIKLEDNAGNALPNPTATLLPITSAYDLDGQDLTPDGAHGTAIDGSNLVYFFTGANTNTLALSPTTLDVSAYGGDGDSIATLPNGDEVVVSADDQNELVVISGILSGAPALADTISVPDYRDGVVISDDGRTLLARGASGLTVFSIQQVAAHPGSIGGSVTHEYTQKVDMIAAGRSSTNYDGRAGMAISPTDYTRAVIIGSPSARNIVSLLTGLPSSPVMSAIALQLPGVKHSAPPPPRHRERIGHISRAGAPIAGANELYAVDISMDGRTAYIGCDAGIVVVGGVNTGTLTQIGSVYSPTFSAGASTYNLDEVRTLGVTLDGKYIAAFTPHPSWWNGTMLLLKIGTNGALSVVGQLTGVPIPSNDQVLMH